MYILKKVVFLEKMKEIFTKKRSTCVMKKNYVYIKKIYKK